MRSLTVLDNIRSEMSECLMCSHGIESKSIHILGSGNQNSNIMFVSDIPRLGDIDARAVLPSSTKYGRVFDRILKDIGLSRSDVYITNMRRCRWS